MCGCGPSDLEASQHHPTEVSSLVAQAIDQPVTDRTLIREDSLPECSHVVITEVFRPVAVLVRRDGPSCKVS